MIKNQKKFSTVAQFDVVDNSISRGQKHLLYPAIAGIVGAILVLYIVGAFFPTEKINLLYFEAVLKSTFTFQDNMMLRGELVSTRGAYEHFLPKIMDNIDLLLTIFLSLFFVIFATTIYLKKIIANKFANKVLEDQHLKGSKTLTEKQLEELQKKDKIEGVTITNNIKVDQETETSHAILFGSAGSGKTVALNQFYRELRKKRSYGRYLVHTVKFDWIERFYNPETDYIFNFSDSRSLNFNIFSMIKLIDDIDSMIASIITRNPDEKDTIWTDTARDILKGILIYCIVNDKKTNIVVKQLIKLSPSQLANKLEGVQGAEIAYGHLTSSESQAGIFMSNFRSKVGFFTSLPDSNDGEELDLEEWLQCEDGHSTIFLVNDVKNDELNSTRIAVFVDSIIKTLLSFSDSDTRRVYFILDELGMLKKIPSIIQGVLLARSLGGAFWLGIQDFGKMTSIYGKELALAIVGSCSSKLIFKLGDPDTREFCANIIGDGKVQSTSMTTSTGAENQASREGSSYTTSEKVEKAILPSELGQLKKNTYYYLNGSYDWALIEKKFTDEDNYPQIAKGFIPRNDLDISNLIKNQNKKSEDTKPTSNGGGQVVEQNNDQQEKIEEKTSNKIPPVEQPKSKLDELGL